jgi:hypothetical protein
MIIKIWRRRRLDKQTIAMPVPKFGIKPFYCGKILQSHRRAREWYMILQ